MLNRRYTPMVLAFVVLIVGILACGPPTPTVPQPLVPPPTVTPYVPPTPPSQPTTQPTTEAPPQETPPSDQPAATDTVPPPTDTLPPPPPPPPATAEPTNTPEPTATETPTQTVSEGPLNFDPPQHICDWEKQGDTNKVVLCIDIRGGTPPFTISHGPTVQGETSDRSYRIEFEWGSCKSAMVQSITVESSDGQKVKKDYFISVDNMPWCED